MARYVIKPDSGYAILTKNGIPVAFITDDVIEFTVRGAFGQVYGKGTTRVEAAKDAARDERIRVKCT